RLDPFAVDRTLRASRRDTVTTGDRVLAPAAGPRTGRCGVLVDVVVVEIIEFVLVVVELIGLVVDSVEHRLVPVLVHGPLAASLAIGHFALSQSCGVVLSVWRPPRGRRNDVRPRAMRTGTPLSVCPTAERLPGVTIARSVSNRPEPPTQG